MTKQEGLYGMAEAMPFQNEAHNNSFGRLLGIKFRIGIPPTSRPETLLSLNQYDVRP